MIEIFDFEATDLHDPRVTQVGKCRLDKNLKLVKDSCKESLINPEKPISFPAMGLTGITNEMVESAPLLEDVLSEFKIHSSTKYVVCHNMGFDGKLFPEGFVPDGVKLLCSLKLARMFVDKELSGDHKNATLYYYLGCHKKPFGKEHIDKTHTALSDVLMTANVLVKLLESNDLTIHDSWDLLYDIKTCKAGKYKGEQWRDIIQDDYSYVEYMSKSDKLEKDEIDHLRGLLIEYKDIKESQLDQIKFGKYKGKYWSDIVESDRDYTWWCLCNLQWRDPDQESYVSALLRE